MTLDRVLLIAAVCATAIPACSGCSRTKSGAPPVAGTGSSRAFPAGDPSALTAKCAAASGGRSFDVGEDKTLRTLAAVPWSDLEPGDTVRIFWKAAPYREKLLVSASGTADAPIRICGVAGPHGELPVIDGDGAVTDKSLDFTSPVHEARGLVTISARHEQRWGVKPQHIVVEGLELENAAAPLAFTSTRGTSQRYFENAACIFVERGEHITLRGNTIHGCGNGIFVASSDDEATQSRDILVEGNYVYGNGSTGDQKDRHHDIYTESIGAVFQFNRIGPVREGSSGIQLKDRSAGTIVRYNWFEGGARVLDLVEAEDSIKRAQKEPAYRRTYVYGNIILLGPGASSRPIHYGGDNGDVADYRKGTLFFYDNTVIIATSKGDVYNMSLLTLETDDESADVRNNIIHNSGDTRLTWVNEKGTVKLGVNWVSRPIQPARDGFTGRFEQLLGNDRTITGDDPGFVDASAGDFCLRPAGPARGVGAALAPVPPALLPTLQYRKHQGRAARSPRGASDLGALVCE